MRNLIIGVALGALCTLTTVSLAEDISGKIRELITQSDPTLQVGQIADSPAAGLCRTDNRTEWNSRTLGFAIPDVRLGRFSDMPEAEMEKRDGP